MSTSIEITITVELTVKKHPSGDFLVMLEDPEGNLMVDGCFTSLDQAKEYLTSNYNISSELVEYSIEVMEDE